MSLLLQLGTTGLVLGLLYGLFAYGLSLIFATTGIFHFAHGLTIVAAAYAFWWVAVGLGLPVWLGILAALLLGAAVGAGAYQLVYRPLLKRKADHTVILVASLTVMTLGQGLLLLIFGTGPKAFPPGDFSRWGFALGPVNIRSWDILVVVSAGVILLALYLLQNKTSFGLALRAVGDNPRRAQTLGFSLTRTYLLAFVIGSLVAAIPGVLIAVQTPVIATLGFSLLLKSVVAIIIGGVGNLTGALYGGLLIGLAESISTFFLPAVWSEFVVFALLFIFIVLRPTGIRTNTARLA